nr:hypothetical protein [Tanacetum cinerariifolium]
MTRSSTKELLTPFKVSKQEFRSSRKLFKTLSLDESRSLEYNLFFDLEENSEEEVAKIMAKTMEQYLNKTRELRDNTFSGSDHEEANEHIEKVLEIVDLFHVHNITQDQIMLQVFFMCLTGAPSKRWQNILKSGTIEHLGQEVLQLLMDWLQFKPNSTILEEKPIRNQGALIKTVEIQIRKISKVLQDIGIDSLPRFTETNSRDHVKSILTTVEADMRPIRLTVMPLSTYLNLGLGELAHTKLTVVKYPKGIAENVLVGIGEFVFLVDFIILDMPEDVKVPLILERLFLSTAHAKIDVFKINIILRVGDEKIIFKSIKHASSLIKKVYMLGLEQRMELDLEARLMGRTLVLNRSLDPLYGEYIKLNDLNVPLELRRDQVDDLMPTIKEGEVIDEPMIEIIKTRNNEGFDEEFYNSVMKEKVEYKGKNVVGALMNVPIIVRNFSVVTNFLVMENMDGYRDQDMGDVIFREPLCKASYVEARRFDRLITIHNGNDNMTYQMARLHPRFKHLSNAKCNNFKPLLKVSVHDKLNGISHPYQKLKSFYKGVLNLGPKYIRHAKMEEWITRGHISMHEMKYKEAKEKI